MAKYIEREALMRRIKEIHCAECDSYNGLRCRACWVDDTLDYIDSEPAADVEPVQEWISVKDRLPEQGEKAICIDADGDMMIGKYTEWGWMFPCYFEELTHWMPIPDLPKGE